MIASPFLTSSLKFIEMHLSDFKDKEFTDYEYMDKWAFGSFKEMEENFIHYLEEFEVGLALNTLEKNFLQSYKNPKS